MPVRELPKLRCRSCRFGTYNLAGVCRWCLDGKERPRCHPITTATDARMLNHASDAERTRRVAEHAARVQAEMRKLTRGLSGMRRDV